MEGERKQVCFEFSVRWIGEIEDMSIIGLESMDLTLPGEKNIFSNH